MTPSLVTSPFMASLVVQRPASAPAAHHRSAPAAHHRIAPTPPALPASTRRPPRLPLHVATTSLKPRPASFVASKLSHDQGRSWTAAWSGQSLGYREAPTPPSLESNSQMAAAGGLLLRIALNRPVSRDAWQDAMVDAERKHAIMRRRYREDQLRIETGRINSAISRRPAPRAAAEWQPPSPSRVVSKWGTGDGGASAHQRKLEQDEAKMAASEAKRNAAKQAQAEAELQAAKEREESWWAWYLKEKEETAAEAARVAEEKRLAEEARLRRKEEARMAKMEAIRLEEAQRKKRVKEEEERVQREAAKQRAELAAQEEAERRAKAEELKAQRRAKKEAEAAP